MSSERSCLDPLDSSCHGFCRHLGPEARIPYLEYWRVYTALGR
jgi:hypothetical protein